jgi:hypothetical protein
MLKAEKIGRVAALILGCVAASQAHAHFTLLKPDSWLNEDALGGPQKGSPCGPGGYDDVQPVPTSGKVTTVHAGDIVSVQWQTTIPHPGYHRIALAENRADLKDPPLTDPVACSYDAASVPNGPHDNVLVDGISADATMQEVTIPNKPCDKCTLQVIDVMQGHGGSSCFYFHCADIKILAASGTGGAGAGGAGGSGTGGSGAAGAGTSGTGAGGKGAAGTSGTAGVGAVAGSGAGGSKAASGSGGSTGTGVVGTGGPVTTGAAGVNSGSAGTVSGGGGAIDTTVTPPAGKKSGCAVSQPGAATSALPVSFVLGLGLGALRLRRRARQLPPRT